MADMKKEVKIQFDYLNGPIWKDKVNANTGKLITGIPCIDNDQELQSLNDEALGMFASLYSFNDGGESCRFDRDKYCQIKPQLLVIAERIISRLQIINDSSFVIADKISDTLL